MVVAVKLDEDQREAAIELKSACLCLALTAEEGNNTVFKADIPSQKIVTESLAEDYLQNCETFIIHLRLPILPYFN